MIGVAGGIAGCVLCYPAGCLGGAALANLGLCPACLGAGLVCDPGPVLAILAAPGCLWRAAELCCTGC